MKMISTLSVATYVCCFLATLGFLQEQGWRGIVPLHSTREDVERLVGPPMSNGITYDLRNERVTIGYSEDRKSTRLNSSHSQISYAVFCLKKKKKQQETK